MMKKQLTNLKTIKLDCLQDKLKVDQRGSNCYNSIYGHVSSYNEHWKTIIL